VISNRLVDARRRLMRRALGGPWPHLGRGARI
jgi:hypothetical protein